LIKKLSVLIILATMMISSIPFAQRVSAQTPTSIFVDPPSIVNEALTPGNTFVINITIANVVNLFAYEFKLFYLNAVLNLTKAIRPVGNLMEPSDPANQFLPKWETKDNFNATHGRAWLSFTLLAPETARTGSGALVQITFKVLSVGSTPLVLMDTKLADDTGSPITHDQADGSFSNVAPPPPAPPAHLAVEPSLIENPLLLPSTDFTVNVTIANATNLNSFEFKLSYSPAIIEAIDVQQGTFLNSTGTTSVLKSEINNTIGFVLFSVGLTAPPGANGNGTLSEIVFNVVANGTSPLTLSDIVLKDPDGQILTFTKTDGLFSNLTTKPGDINGDGVVDLFDLVEAAIRFGATPADTQRWNPEADLNHDGIINVFDLIQVCIYFTEPLT